MCECGHPRSKHTLEDGECLGQLTTIDPQQWQWCPCKAYRAKTEELW